MPKGMSTVLKGILLVVGSYVVTIVVAAFIIVLGTMVLVVEPYDCSVMNRAVVILWVMIAMLFLASVAVVRTVARKISPSAAGRRAVVVIHGLVMLASYVVVAFGLMVAFEC